MTFMICAKKLMFVYMKQRPESARAHLFHALLGQKGRLRLLAARLNSLDGRGEARPDRD